ncbi:hypothetical protein SERLADRAFT_367830 [Serpula lacrymans var. lacrymans S7.9]|uniref:Non-ribosomal peptide synthetase n=1 Tax=Serpula lacrymans var. lacrymans (strain S7.9) TaxID=578457 RepID=F8NRC0_SERL9|nr:uncharacterized protein SERLADRAFT_367830 [Serpula lacrymans var. lacrymans S7.9]EGO26239.1 hypothetical protein SERLADRAFT_367830 [Serpula lacrymans var. lacrymans S7.9]
MSSQTSACDMDPEKGTMDSVLPSPAPSVISPPSVYELKQRVTPPSRSKFHIKLSSVSPNKDAEKKSKKNQVSRWVQFQLWFNTYRKFYCIILIINLVGLVLAATGVWAYPHQYSGALLLGNLQTAILMRNELFLRFLYLLVNSCFAKWTPLWFRLSCTSALQHIGGIHSGCATSGCIWLTYRVVILFIEGSNDAVLATGITTDVAVAISIASAFPWVRNNHHNVFERHHRFIGCYDLETRSMDPKGTYILRQQDFWYIFIMTILVIIPWVTVRQVKVDVEIPSPKVVILRFERGMQQGLLARISRGCIWEYHAFGIISEGTHAKYHYLICGVQGDFTRRLVDDPPKYLWTRQLKFAGVSNTSALYKRGIRVCTGTGLGAALSTCLQLYLIWIGSDQEKTFGPTISGLIHRHLGPERVTLWDSKQRGGRPDIMKLLKEIYDSWQAEVIFITSNYQGNKEMMEGCKQAGMPAFGTLWDF